jgi:hypothetical protein
MIIPQQLSDIARLVESQGLDDKVMARLRGIYPGVHFTCCLDEEINDAKPVWESPRFNIYLVDSRNYCLRLTDSAEAATGLVLAEVVANSL